MSSASTSPTDSAIGVVVVRSGNVPPVPSDPTHATCQTIVIAAGQVADAFGLNDEELRYV
ncbi:MAG: hypothetical protein ACYDD7_02730 [Acidimicrobiales bacterium]